MTAADTVARPRPNRLWAELMQRSFGFDVRACPRCGDRLDLIAVIDDPRVVGRILRHLGLPTEVPSAGPPLPWSEATRGTTRRLALPDSR
jgi:hypothetical protein